MPHLLDGRVTRALASLATALGLVVATPALAYADDVEMTGLGDSYASGVGAGSYDDDSGSCQRSPYGYAAQGAERIGADLTFVACSGATTSDVLDSQLDALSSDTDVVTLTVGGNDIGFVPVITTCAQPWWSSDCDAAIDGAQAKIADELPGSLDALYAEIEAASPDAEVVVTGYPYLFMGEDCNAGTWFSPAEQERLNETGDLLNDAVAEGAEAHGFTFVDPRDAFTGHAVCDDDAWINGLTHPISDSYHPNESGHTAYADLVDDYLV